MSMRRAVSFTADPSLNRPPSPTEGTAFFRQHAQKGQRKDISIDLGEVILQLPFLNPSPSRGSSTLVPKRKRKKEKQTSTNNLVLTM